MQPIIGLISLALGAYGFTQDGMLGILTGLIAGFGIGSGLSVLAATKFTEGSSSRSERNAERLGGFISAVACAAGIYFGGWALGSVFGMAGYAAGILTTFLLEEIASRRAGNRPKIGELPRA